MKSTLINIFAFVAGAGIGSAITWKIVKTKYEQIAQEEIDSVKEVYLKKTKELESEPEEDDSPEPEVEAPKKKVIAEKPDISVYAEALKKEGYMEYSKKAKPEEKEKEKEVYTRDMDTDFGYSPEPYVIAPEHFDEYDDYEAESLSYYSDGYLVDDQGNEIEDVDGIVGYDFAEHFGEFEDDSVFIRNERLKTDFEILAVEGNFKDSK